MAKDKTLFQYSIKKYEEEKVDEIKECYKDYLTTDLLINLMVVLKIAIREAYRIGRIDKENEGEKRCQSKT